MAQDSFSSPPHVEAKTQQAVTVHYVPDVRAYAGPGLNDVINDVIKILLSHEL
jgi:hypothetical protein